MEYRKTIVFNPMYLCTPVCCQGCFYQTITGIIKSNNLTLAMIAINRLKASINQILGSFMWKMPFSQEGILVIITVSGQISWICIKDKIYEPPYDKTNADWVDAQADLSLRWAQMSFCWFVMRWLISWSKFALYVMILALCSLSIFRYQCPPLRTGPDVVLYLKLPLLLMRHVLERGFLCITMLWNTLKQILSYHLAFL